MNTPPETSGAGSDSATAATSESAAEEIKRLKGKS
jgi:hypothetical protein